MDLSGEQLHQNHWKRVGKWNSWGGLLLNSRAKTSQRSVKKNSLRVRMTVGLRDLKKNRGGKGETPSSSNPMGGSNDSGMGR